VVGGAVVARDADTLATLSWWANALGITGAPFDSFLTLRGLRTLDARVRVHQENAQAIARRLLAHPAVRVVHYPGLASHPQHALAVKQQRGPGAMIGFELQGGVEAVRAFLDGLGNITLAESLGGVESLVAHPATMTHAAMSAPARAAAGIGDGLLRLSVGIECVEDLWADLGAGLARAQRALRTDVEVSA
jgi:cystathionine gamma-synthase